MPKSSGSGSSNTRGRGTYNSACDVCARKKIKCDGNKPICQPCSQGRREGECVWSKNSARGLRTEQRFKAMHKNAENFKEQVSQWKKYADYLESELDKCPHRSGEFRSSRPSSDDGLLGPLPDIPDDELDFASNDSDGNSDSEDLAKEMCIPMQSLKLEENGFYHYGNTAPFRFDYVEPLPPSTQPSRFPALAQNPDATYVLLTEGVPDSYGNPHFDWSRHLPNIVPMDRRSHDKALDLLFKFFASWPLRIVPALFLRDMYRALCLPPSHVPLKTPHYSPMLHNALLALALAFVDDPKLRDLKSRQYFADKALSYMVIECSKPSLSVVIALSTLANFYSSIGEDTTLGYLFFGMSVRMAQAMGLNVNCSEWVKAGFIDEADLLDRRWTYWTTISQDVLWSFYVGREFSMSSPTIETAASNDNNISMPLVDHDYDQLPWIHPLSKLEPQPNYLTKTFQATCELLMNGRRIMDAVNRLDRSNSHPCAIDELVTAIDLDLHKWEEGLSPELAITHESQQTATPHKLMMHLTYWWLLILLHRPFFQRKRRFLNDGRIDSVERCQVAAEKIMQLVSTWRTLYTLRYCPIALIQTVFSAGTVYLLTGIQAKTVAWKELDHCQHQQTLILQYLDEISKSWQCATNIAGIMQNLVNEQSKFLLEHKTTSLGSDPTVIVAVEDDNDSDFPCHLSKDRGRRHSSSIKPINSRSHSLNKSSIPLPVSNYSSLSLDNSNYQVQQDTFPFAVSASPEPSIPIAIEAPPNNNSYFASNNPSIFPSFSYPSSVYRFNLFGASSARPVVAGPSSPYATSKPSSTSFSRYDPNIGSYGQAIAHPPPVLDEVAFTASHLFQGNNILLDIPQELGAGQLLQPSSVHQVADQENFAESGMQDQGALLMESNYPAAPSLLPEPTFTLNPLQMFPSSTHGLPNYNSSAVIDEDFYANLDTNMDKDKETRG